MTYRERRMARAERLRGWADKRDAKSEAAFASAMGAIEHIPPGQPILVDHYSARRHLSALDRHDRGMRAGFENADKAASMRSRADNIEAAADAAIYSDDPDAVERLEAKLAGLEAERAAIVAFNKAVRKKGADPAALVEALSPGLRRDWERSRYGCRRDWADTPGGYSFPQYATGNLSGNISRLRQRLERLKRASATPAEKPERIVPEGYEADPAIWACPDGPFCVDGCLSPQDMADAMVRELAASAAERRRPEPPEQRVCRRAACVDHAGGPMRVDHFASAHGG